MKTKKQLLDNRLLFTSILTFFLMILFFSVTYWNSQRSTINGSNCQKANNTISADGLVTINEADLRCAGAVERDRSSKEAINLASITLGLACAGLTLLFLSLSINNHHKK